nr:immunoglobulin heavy chain junction region [Macaca mulatta]MOV36582.1 immunoglobulin heavy chain junction region [Macaca mulatta]MOV36784.1 immunoglobulin heavy chain junction region [Macaca mulatta]
CTARYSAYSFW